MRLIVRATDRIAVLNVFNYEKYIENGLEH